MEKDLKVFLESGLLERYMMGTCSREQKEEVLVRRLEGLNSSTPTRHSDRLTNSSERGQLEQRFANSAPRIRLSPTDTSAP